MSTELEQAVGSTMRAAVVRRYGPAETVGIERVPTPAPSRGQVQVRVAAAGVTSGDARIRGARFPAGFGALARLAFGVRRPRRPVLGGTFAGTVTAVGAGVTTLKPGDRVCGMTGARLGTHAEVLVTDARRGVRVPDGVSDDDAAGVLFGGTTALHFLRKARCGPGQRVLVNGGSGGVGTNAIQLARHLGAHVTAVSSQTDLVTSLGAEDVIDYTATPLTDVDRTFDIVLDTVGTLTPRTGRRLLAPGGRLVLVVAGLRDTLAARAPVIAGTAPERPEDIAHLLRLVDAGELQVVHDRAYPLDEIAAAYRLVDGGHKRGNVIVHPTPAGTAVHIPPGV